MADLSNLQLTQENIEVSDNYVDASEFPPPIPAGTYELIQGKPEFTVTKGFLSANMTHEVANGPEAGARLSFDRISNKPFDRQGVKVNMMTDHLRAIGDKARYTTHQQYADALEAGEGKTFKAQVDWEGGCNHDGTPQACEWADANVTRVKGMKNFPANGNGGYLQETKCATCGQTIQARSRISRRIPQ